MPQKMTKMRIVHEQHGGEHLGHRFKCSANTTYYAGISVPKVWPIRKLMTGESQSQAQEGNDWLYSDSTVTSSVLTLLLATSILCFFCSMLENQPQPTLTPTPQRLFLSESAHSQASWSVIGSTGLQAPEQAAAVALRKHAPAARQEASGGSRPREASPQVWEMASYSIEKGAGGFTVPVATVREAQIARVLQGCRLGGWRKHDWRKRCLPTSHLTVNTENPSFSLHIMS